MNASHAAASSAHEPNVLRAAAGVVPRDVFNEARHYDDTEWEAVSAGLVDRGLLGRDGNLTARGQAVRDDVEERTDRIALSAYEVLDDGQLQQLIDALVPLTRAVIAAGDIPEVTPIGARFDV